MKAVTENRESPAGNSQLSLFWRCERSWAFKYILGYRYAGLSLPLDLGSAVHEAQEVFYTTGQLDKSLSKGRAILKARGYEADHDAYTRMTGSITGWVKAYGQADLDNEAVLEVEKEYPLTLLNGYGMTIRVDSLMQDNDGIFIRDTKSTGKALSLMIRQYMYEPQPVLYIEALNQSSRPDKDKLYGWRTDVIHSRMLKSGLKVECERSDIVMPTNGRIEDVILAYTVLTERIAKAIKEYESGVPLKIAFPCNPKACFAFNSECAHYAHCSTSRTKLPVGFSLDPWLDERTVLKTFDGIKEALK